MGQAHVGHLILPVPAKLKLNSGQLTILITVLLAAIGGTWTLSSRIGGVSDSLRSEIHQSESKLAGRLDELGQRVSALEGRVGAISARFTQGQEELEQRISKLPSDQRVAAVASAVERKLALVRVAQLETRILSQLGPTTRTMVGTLLSVVPSERIIAIEDQSGRSRGFVLGNVTTAKGFCGGFEEVIQLTDIPRGTAVLVAYEPASGGRHPTVRVVVKSSCA